jgi:hypothetical protein
MGNARYKPPPCGLVFFLTEKNRTWGSDRPLPASAASDRQRGGPWPFRAHTRVPQASWPDYRCTTGQVRVRVTPLMAWMRDTTSWPRASMLRASARTMTSYGPATGWACWTPLISAAELATCPVRLEPRCRRSGRVLVGRPVEGTTACPPRAAGSVMRPRPTRRLRPLSPRALVTARARPAADRKRTVGRGQRRHTNAQLDSCVLPVAARQATAGKLP